jgi:glycosyltransferase involved in cell wall biosynthesis
VKVVFVDHVARLSGGEIALLRLLPALAAHVDVHVILGEDGPLADRLREVGIATEVLPLPERLRDVRKDTVHPRGLSALAVVEVPAYVARLVRRLRLLDPDVVHTNSLKAALYGGAAGRLARRPVVWHVRDRIASDYLPGPAVRLVHTAARVLPSAIVANSHATLETLPARGGLVGDRRVVVPSSVVPPPLDGRGPDGDLVVGIMGRLAPWKGQDVFVRAFAEAFQEAPVRGRIIGSPLFGEDDYADSLERLVSELGLEGRIEFRGFKEDVWQELAELDVLVHCSITPEPFGQVVLEGLAAGLPVVAAGAGGPAELITNGVDGLLTPPGDVAALATTLRALRDDPKLRDRLGRAGRKRSADFTPERAAETLVGLYRELAPR